MDVLTTDPADSYTRSSSTARRTGSRQAGMEKAAAFLETHRYAA
jgi:hypothetical protein